MITDTVYFHCQQVVEKYLKAFLVKNGIAPDKTHKIESLLNNCCQIDSSFIELEGIVVLTEYAVELRYPDDFYIPSIEEAQSALSLAKKVKSFVLSKLLFD